MADTPKFPMPRRWNGRVFFVRSEVERFKRRLICGVCGGGGPQEPVFDGPEELLSKKELARELGVSTRTVDRRLTEKAS